MFNHFYNLSLLYCDNKCLIFAPETTCSDFCVKQSIRIDINLGEICESHGHLDINLFFNFFVLFYIDVLKYKNTSIISFCCSSERVLPIIYNMKFMVHNKVFTINTYRQPDWFWNKSRVEQGSCYTRECGNRCSPVRPNL